MKIFEPRSLDLVSKCNRTVLALKHSHQLFLSFSFYIYLFTTFIRYQDIGNKKKIYTQCLGKKVDMYEGLKKRCDRSHGVGNTCANIALAMLKANFQTIRTTFCKTSYKKTSKSLCFKGNVKRVCFAVIKLKIKW